MKAFWVTAKIAGMEANRLETAREQRRVKREQTGDTAEAKADRARAERRKQTNEYDPEEMKKSVGNPGAALLS